MAGRQVLVLGAAKPSSRLMMPDGWHPPSTARGQADAGRAQPYGVRPGPRRVAGAHCRGASWSHPEMRRLIAAWRLTR